MFCANAFWTFKYGSIPKKEGNQSGLLRKLAKIVDKKHGRSGASSAVLKFVNRILKAIKAYFLFGEPRIFRRTATEIG